LIGVVGQVVRRKGQIYLLRALPEILAARPDVRCLLVGDFDRRQDYTRMLRSYLARHKLYRRVIWAGKQQQVPAFMAALDVCVVPSLEEPLGLVALEAQAAGVPLVATATGGLTEVVAHEHNGLIVTPRDAAAIARGVLRLLDQPRLAATLAAQGRCDVLARFSLPKLTQDVADILQQAARKSRSAA
jgi:glycosyltransferase involved in cell wall biosynthesis